MPVSKKRKKKRVVGTPPPPKGGHQPKPKITKQRLLLYIISAVMIISLAASFVISSTGRNTAVPQTQTVDGSNLLTDPPAVETTQDEPATDEQEDVAPEEPGDSEGESGN